MKTHVDFKSVKSQGKNVWKEFYITCSSSLTNRAVAINPILIWVFIGFAPRRPFS